MSFMKHLLHGGILDLYCVYGVACVAGLNGCMYVGINVCYWGISVLGTCNILTMPVLCR